MSGRPGVDPTLIPARPDAHPAVIWQKSHGNPALITWQSPVEGRLIAREASDERALRAGCGADASLGAMNMARWDWEPDTGFDDEVIDRAVRRLGRAIYLSRRRNGWRQRKLALRSGVDQGSISRLERGLLHNMSLSRLAILLQALGDIVAYE